MVEIRGMLSLRGAEDLLLGEVTWPKMPIFELGRAMPVKSHVWKFGLDWLKSELCIFGGGGGGGGGQKLPIRGHYMWPAMPIFELGQAIPVKSHVWKFGSDWLSLSRVIVSTNIHKKKKKKKKKKKNHRHNWIQHTSFWAYKNSWYHDHKALTAEQTGLSPVPHIPQYRGFSFNTCLLYKFSALCVLEK